MFIWLNEKLNSLGYQQIYPKTIWQLESVISNIMCYGCLNNAAGQLYHMEYMGCLNVEDCKKVLDDLVALSEKHSN